MRAMHFYVKPVGRLMPHWLAYAVTADGKVAWQTTALSEGGARTACQRKQAQLARFGQFFTK